MPEANLLEPSQHIVVPQNRQDTINRVQANLEESKRLVPGASGTVEDHCVFFPLQPVFNTQLTEQLQHIGKAPRDMQPSFSTSHPVFPRCHPLTSSTSWRSGDAGCDSLSEIFCAGKILLSLPQRSLLHVIHYLECFLRTDTPHLQSVTLNQRRQHSVSRHKLIAQRPFKSSRAITVPKIQIKGNAVW